ncbi:mycofactocin system transcriptional regulator [Gordonia amicalis]|uniref:Mycofactocin system transcriptional regulator n=1 Tax=Gordonia amicalis TaxID=89053 RepID=A0AAE4UA06_9ACTN|nr:mycofactocin system transcriptional regulator [Gordonia amicalis]MBA5846696.1 mycofactocin system transcriptional regulator [Gordonia amicalis]MCZ4580531.1 mycofactocin system transcriptional regulator [Gordonia amicalis]MDV6311327.1 mycofactocin system transcriptional regulator [Gordonia amicalis]MDV7101401.1 mycofactocin system transcriptional regulator [Gordonia amicalis]MDV7174000.1 mycofactocin system transcriptional regulator [Gordonia amicalis]
MTTQQQDTRPQRPAPGRRPISSRARISALAIGLFTTRGFEETSVDDIAEAAGIARRTLFRYYSSKNEIPWGEFDDHLGELRGLLAQIPADTPMADALVEALVAFNRVPPEELDNHRRRMSLLLGVPALQAHSMIMYADWRHVIAEFCATRLGLDDTDHLPQTIGWLCLGAALAAYEQWLSDPDADLEALIADGARIVANGVASLARTA